MNQSNQEERVSILLFKMTHTKHVMNIQSINTKDVVCEAMLLRLMAEMDKLIMPLEMFKGEMTQVEFEVFIEQIHQGFQKQLKHLKQVEECMERGGKVR